MSQYRDEVESACRRINRKACWIASAVLGVYASVIMLCWFGLGLSPSEVLAVSTVLFQLGVIGWGLGYIFSYFEKTMVRMDYSIRLGAETAEHIDLLQRELTPVIGDLRQAVADAKTVIHELRQKELEKITRVLDQISTDGNFAKAVAAFIEIPKKLDELAKKAEKGTVDRMLDGL